MSGERESIRTKEAAAILGTDTNRAALWMWNHGFNEAPKKKFQGRKVRHWYLDEVIQVRQERIDWGLSVAPGHVSEDDEARSLGLGPRIHIKDIGQDRYGPTVSTFDADAARLRRERIAEQLRSAPVSAVDLDYIASRAGGRRGRHGPSFRGVGATEHILEATKAGTHKKGTGNND